MTIQLTPRMQAQVDEIIGLGAFSDTEVVVEQALDLLIEQERLRMLQEKLQAADDQYLTGEYEEYSREVFVEIRDSALEQFRKGERASEDARW